jgi:hypothetical protein
MKGPSHLIAAAANGPQAVATPRAADQVAGVPRHLTTADLAARWRVAPYTIREWARAGRITDATFALGEWTFLDTSRLILEATEGSRPNGVRLVDLAAYPMTVADLAAAWGRAEDTVRRWARAGLLASAVLTPLGWRFGAEVADPSKPMPRASSGQPGALGAPDQPEAEDTLAELRALSFEVRLSGPPASGRTPRSASAVAYAEHRKNGRGPRAMYRR